MGLENTGYEKKTYVNIVAGKFAIRGNEGDSGVVSRTNKNNVTVYEKLYEKLSGVLNEISVRKNDKLGAYEYVIEMNDVGDKYFVSIPADSKYGDNLAKKIPNIKKGVYSTLSPYDFEDKERKTQMGKPSRNTGLTVIQNNEKVAAFYTKENQGKHPQNEGNMDEEEYKIFMIKVRKFYRGVVEEFSKRKEVSTVANPNPVPDNKDASDLPF